MDQAKSCCFTGHRPAKLPWGADEDDPRCRDLKAEIAARLQGIYEAGYRHFICGMAAGCDLYFAEAVLELRRQKPDVTLEAAIPCDSQADSWPGALRQRYDALVADCDEVSFVSHAYSPGCMQKRNRYMVEHASLLLACYDGSPGGTMSTILMALRRRCRVIVIEI